MALPFCLEYALELKCMFKKEPMSCNAQLALTQIGRGVRKKCMVEISSRDVRIPMQD